MALMMHDHQINLLITLNSFDLGSSHLSESEEAGVHDFLSIQRIN